MKSSIKSFGIALLLVATFVGCNQGESLQTYFVDNQETPGFFSVDIPVSFINLEDEELTDEQKEAYESIDKLNMLAFHLDDNNEEMYKAEFQKVQALVKDERYQELFRAGNNKDGKIVIKYIGSDTTIDELILIGNMNAAGFAVVRVLGNGMEPAKIMKLGSVIQNLQTDENDVRGFMKFFDINVPDEEETAEEVTEEVTID